MQSLAQTARPVVAVAAGRHSRHPLPQVLTVVALVLAIAVAIALLGVVDFTPATGAFPQPAPAPVGS